jgi:hypothetical protein
MKEHKANFPFKKIEELDFPNMTTDFIARVIKAMWYQHRDKQTNGPKKGQIDRNLTYASTAEE